MASLDFLTLAMIDNRAEWWLLLDIDRLVQQDEPDAFSLSSLLCNILRARRRGAA